MPYLLIVIGGFFIYLSIMKNRDAKINEEPFKVVLEDKIIDSELSTFNNQLHEALLKIDNLESSILILEEKIHNMCSIKENITVNSYDSSKDFVESTDNNVEDDINLMIYKLKDEGKDLEEICSILKLGKGEVLLRLGLRK